MSRRGQHWVTQQLRRALLDFAHAPESELSKRSSAVIRGDDPVVSPKRPSNASSATDSIGDQEKS